MTQNTCIMFLYIMDIHVAASSQAKLYISRNPPHRSSLATFYSVTRRQGSKLPFLTAALPISILYVLRELHISQSDLCLVSIQGHLHLWWQTAWGYDVYLFSCIHHGTSASLYGVWLAEWVALLKYCFKWKLTVALFSALTSYFITW